MQEPQADQTPRGGPGIPPQSNDLPLEAALAAPAFNPSAAFNPFGAGIVKAAPPENAQKSAADPRAEKLDLRVGVYQNSEGQSLPMRTVSAAELQLLQEPAHAKYLPTEGHAHFRESAARLVFGAEYDSQHERIASVQTLGASNALRLAAEFLGRHFPGSCVYFSEATWADNHRIFAKGGLSTGSHRYYDPENRKLAFDRMLEDLAGMPARSIVVLQACAHNPTGLDPSRDEWRTLARFFRSSELIPILDVAYQGFADGLEADSFATREFLDSGLSFAVAQCCSKNFSLYNRRIGSLHFVTAGADEANNVLGQLKTEIRAAYSNPPADGALIVSRILGDPLLEKIWRQELDEMRERVGQVRSDLAGALTAQGSAHLFPSVEKQKGLFCFTGLGKAAVQFLEQDHAIYLLGNGRLCLPALNERNLERVALALGEAALKHPSA